MEGEDEPSWSKNKLQAQSEKEGEGERERRERESRERESRERSQQLQLVTKVTNHTCVSPNPSVIKLKIEPSRCKRYNRQCKKNTNFI